MRPRTAIIALAVVFSCGLTTPGSAQSPEKKADPLNNLPGPPPSDMGAVGGYLSSGWEIKTSVVVANSPYPAVILQKGSQAIWCQLMDADPFAKLPGGAETNKSRKEVITSRPAYRSNRLRFSSH
jgi:hypothetical protein